MAYSREIEKLERQFAENPRRFAAPFADALRKSADVTRALEVIQVGLELNPEYIPGSVILGRCHLDLGDDHAAEAAFSRVLDLDNENVIALKSLADIMERQGRHDEAVSFLTYLLDVDRSNDEAREQLARIEAEANGRPATPPATAGRSTAAEAPAVAEAALPPSAPDAPAEEAPSSPPSQMEEFLEPTALWEPPDHVSEASISSWVEPTSAESVEEVEPAESLLPDDTADDVAPLAGLEGAAMEGAEESVAGEFFLEREEEIVLTGSVGTDYQVRNDSEDLLGHPDEDEDEAPAAPPAAPPPLAAEAPEVEEEREVIEEEVEAIREEPAAEAVAPPEMEEEREVTGAEATEVEEPSALEDEAPLEWAMHIGEGQEFVPAHTHGGVHPPDSFDAAIEGIAPVDEEVVDAEDEEAEAAAEDEPAGDEAPVLMVTESMAELYASQGHAGEALGVYRILFDRNPDNERLRLRIQDLEAALAAEVGANAAPSYAASVTGGKAVASFLGSMLEARPAHVDLPEPPPAPEASDAEESGEETSKEAVASGAPTRPAVDRLSLGAIFGEDPSPVPPAENAAAPEKGGAAPGFSFDDFFGGGTAAPSGKSPAASVRSSRASDDEDDLDQFHSWLQSLKR